MPNCVQFFKIGSTEAAKFSEIDKELCEFFKVECHPKYWYLGWYDVIAFHMACWSNAKFDDIIFDPDYTDGMRDIARYLRDHYTTHAWAEIGRH